jgi:DNA-binding LytR/AlgR family response regulator
LKDYRGAAIEAHAAAALGPIIDWPSLYSYYGNARTYGDQLRALATYIRSHPSAADARFLLGYQEMILGHFQVAEGELAQAMKLTPTDELTQRLLKRAESRLAAGTRASTATSAPGE